MMHNKLTVILMAFHQICSVASLQVPLRLPPPSNSVRAATTALASSSAGNVAANYPSSQFSLEFFETPGSKETPHNFGPASPLDSILFSAERPGNPSTKDGKVETEQVQKWIKFIRGQGVTNVIGLLNEDELEIYNGTPGLEEMYKESGMEFHLAPMGDEGASARILDIIDKVEQQGGKVVTHCTGGIGRCGRVAAAWLVHRYQLSPEVATLITLDQAAKSGVKRLGHTQKLAEWLE